MVFNVTDKLYHIILYRVHIDWAGFASFKQDKYCIHITKDSEKSIYKICFPNIKYT